MGSIPELSIIKGIKKNLEKRKLHQIFEDRLRETNSYENQAIIYKENGNTVAMTYGQLNDASNKMARSMLKKINDNQIPVNNDGDFIIAVSMQPSDSLLITLLAIWKCGGAYLPLDPTFPEQRIKHILNESKPAIIVYDETSKIEYFDDTLSISYVTLANESINNSSDNIPEIHSLSQKTENLAIVLYTSGSTGIPKGVRLPHDIILNRLQWQFDEFPYSQTEKVCIFKTALTFVDSVCEIWGPLLNGLTILVISKSITRDPQRLVDELNAYQIERLVLVPSLLRSILLYLSLNKEEKSLTSLRLWISSGEPLSVSLAEEFFNYFSSCQNHVLCNFYGSTEVMGDVTYFTMKNKASLRDLSKVPIGNPVDNTIIYLLDENLQPVARGNTGELWVSGCNLAAGYVNGRDPDRFIPNPLAQNIAYSRIYRTGDFAKIEKETIVYEGRTDSQIKIRGHRVDLSEVEKSVIAIDGIDKGVVLCYKPGEMDQALLAFVTSVPNSKITGLQVEGLLQDKLAAYMIPQVVFLDNIPLLVNGKVDRQALLKMYESTNNNDDDNAIILDIDYSGIPSSKMTAAEVLFKTVGSVIGRSTRNTLSVKSNYYNLGGNSLNSIFTISQLKQQGYNIGITDFIMASNLGEILDLICLDSGDSKNSLPKKQLSKYTYEPLHNNHKSDCLRMLITSFYEKAELEQLVKSQIKEDDYADILNKTWDELIKKNLSFIVKQEDGKTIGLAFNFDVRDEPDVDIDSGLKIIFEFLEHLEGPMRDQHIPTEVGQVVHSFMMATHENLTPQENIAVIKFMEEELVGISRKKGFMGIFTTNTSPLTQQLGRDVLGYDTLLEYQLNKFISGTGNAPFLAATDDQTAIVCFKRIA